MRINSVKVAAINPWWARPYLYTCVLFAVVFGMQPDVDKIVARVVRNTKWKVDL